MSIRDEARQEAERERIAQSNDIAYTVIEVAQNKTPNEFVTLDFRYGIADALWDAGYRKAEQEPSDAEVEAAAKTFAPDAWAMDPYDYLDAYQGRAITTYTAPGFQSAARIRARRQARAALQAAKEARRG